MNIRVAILFFIILSFTVSMGAKAQNKDSVKNLRDIDIERNYTPEVRQADRPNVTYKPQEPKSEDKKTKINYSKFSQKFDVPVGAFIPLQPEGTNSLNRKDPKRGFLRVGAGPLFTWMTDFWYPIWNTKEGYFDIYAYHDGIIGIGTPTKRLINTEVGINFKKNLDEKQLYLSAKYFNDIFNYYGQNDSIRTSSSTTDWDTVFVSNQSLNRADFTLGLNTLERDANDINWDAYLNYRLLSSAHSVAEHNINAIATVNKLFDENYLHVDAGINTYFYKNKDSLKISEPQFNFISKSKWKPNIILFAKPSYTLSFEDIKIKLGIKTFFSFGKNPFFAVSPDVKIDYHLRDILNLYAGITGDYKPSSLLQTTSENRYYNLMEALYLNTYTPFDIFAGFKVKMLKGLMFDASINYKYTTNKVFYKNPTLLLEQHNSNMSGYVYNRYFSADYGKGTLFEAKARLNYNIREFILLYTQLNYQKWSLKQNNENIVKHAWHTPDWRISAGGEIKFDNGFFGNLEMYFLSKQKAEQYSDISTQTQQVLTLPAVFDLNLGAGYNINKDFSLFARANNILGISPALNQSLWYGYRSFGFHMLIGITLQF